MLRMLNLTGEVSNTEVSSYIPCVMKYINRYANLITVLAILLLIILAGMQYQWLSEISRSQKNRIQNQMQSGAKSFSTEFDALFSETASSIDLLGNKSGMKEQLRADYKSWLNKAEYPELLIEIYLIPPSLMRENGALAYDAGSDRFRDLEATELKHLKNKWQFERKVDRVKNGEMLFLDKQSLIIKRAPKTHNYFDEFVDLLAAEEDLRSYLSNEMESSYIVLILDNKIIRQQILPNFYDNFFGSDHPEQFNLVIKDNFDNHIYHQTHDLKNSPDNPEIEQDIGELELRSFVIVFAQNSEPGDKQTDAKSRVDQVLDTTLKKITKTSVNSLKFSFNTNTSSRSDSSEPIKIHNRIISDSLKIGFTDEEGQLSTSAITNSETPETGSQLSLEVFMREGDLEAYITGTLWKNMGISLSILFILGLAIGLVSHNARASQNLADKQMMFVAGISHELKTPISVINSAAENMQDGLIRKTQKMKEYGKMIHKEGNRLKGMVNQVMQLAELQSDQMEIHKESVKVNTLIDQAEIQMSAILNDVDIKLEYYEESEDLSLNADPDMMVQVLVNLISNAIKYRSHDSRIILRSQKRDDNIEISVQDFGAGIPEHEQKYIFDPFYRGEMARKNQIQGNGLGLYIIKQLVERHGGRIEINSTPGEGTTFTIYLPNN